MSGFDRCPVSIRFGGLLICVIDHRFCVLSVVQELPCSWWSPLFPASNLFMVLSVAYLNLTVGYCFHWFWGVITIFEDTSSLQFLILQVYMQKDSLESMVSIAILLHVLSLCSSLYWWYILDCTCGSMRPCQASVRLFFSCFVFSLMLNVMLSSSVSCDWDVQRYVVAVDLDVTENDCITAFTGRLLAPLTLLCSLSAFCFSLWVSVMFCL